ncbi:MAG: hypothetical protein Q8P07_00330 [bacterium]|nr:hypothetical protein [bacterium]
MTLKVVTKQGIKEIDSLKLQQTVLDMLSAEAEIEVVADRILEDAVGVMLNQKNQEFGDKLAALFAEYFDAVSAARGNYQAHGESEPRQNKNIDYANIKFVALDGKVKKIDVDSLIGDLNTAICESAEKLLSVLFRKIRLINGHWNDLADVGHLVWSFPNISNLEDKLAEILRSFIKENSDYNLACLEKSLEQEVLDKKTETLRKLAEIKNQLKFED